MQSLCLQHFLNDSDQLIIVCQAVFLMGILAGSQCGYKDMLCENFEATKVADIWYYHEISPEIDDIGRVSAEKG